MKHNIRHIRILLLVYAFLYLTLTCKAGWVLSETITDNYGNTSFQTTFIQKNKIRFENSTSITILNINDSLLTIVFPTLRAYWQGTPAMLMEDMIDAFDVQVQSLIIGLPYDQRDNYQAMYDSIKQQMQSKKETPLNTRFKIAKTNRYEQVNDYHCQLYQIQVDSVTKEELWVSNQVQPYTEVDIPLFIEMNNRINLYSQQGHTVNSQDYFEMLKNGLIVKSLKLGKNNHYLATEVSEIKQANIPDDFFAPPTNYRKVNLVEVFDLPPINSDTTE